MDESINTRQKKQKESGVAALTCDRAGLRQTTYLINFVVRI